MSSSDSSGEKSLKHTFFRCNPLKCIFLGVPFLGHSSLCYTQAPNKTSYALSDLSNKFFRASNWDFYVGNSRGSCRRSGPLDPHQIPAAAGALALAQVSLHHVIFSSQAHRDQHAAPSAVCPLPCDTRGGGRQGAGHRAVTVLLQCR